MNKKADEAFEKKRREALEKYAQKTGNTEFQLAEKPAPAVAVHHKEFVPANKPQPVENTASNAVTSNIGQEQNSVVSSGAAEQEWDHRSELDKWKEEQEKKEEEFRQRISEEQRRKAETIKKMQDDEYEEKKRQAALHEQQKLGQQSEQKEQIPPVPLNCCAGCRQEFKGILDIFIVKDQKYCKECSIKALSDKPNAPKCGYCALPLSTSIIKAAGKRFHPECFNCCKCGLAIRGGFRQEGKNTFVCVGCTSGFGK